MKTHELIIVAFLASFSLQSIAQPINDPRDFPIQKLQGNVKQLTKEVIYGADKPRFSLDIFSDNRAVKEKPFREHKYTFSDNRIIKFSEQTNTKEGSYTFVINYQYDINGWLIENKKITPDSVLYLYHYTYELDEQNRVVQIDKIESKSQRHERRIIEYNEKEILIKYLRKKEEDFQTIRKYSYDLNGILICSIHSPGTEKKEVEDIENLEGANSYQYFYNDEGLLLNKVSARKGRNYFSGNYQKYFYKGESKEISKIKYYQLGSEYVDTSFYFYPKDLESTIRYKYKYKNGKKIKNAKSKSEYKINATGRRSKSSWTKVFDKHSNLILYYDRKRKVIEKYTIQYF